MDKFTKRSVHLQVTSK